MSPHIVVQLTNPLPDRIPSWQHFVHDKSICRSSTHTAIDQALAQYNQQVFVTSEYQPRGNSWTRDEVEAGLNRFYRIILRNTRHIPAGLLQEISINTDVQEARPPQFVTTPLPDFSRATSTSSRKRHPMLNFLSSVDVTNYECKIAVLDTGVNNSHPELNEAMIQGMDFVDILDGADDFVGDFLGVDPEPEDEVGHGTHVAGIIAGKGINMPQGIAPWCSVLPVKVLGAFKDGNEVVGAGLLENIDAGIKYAVDQGADIINMSLGVQHAGGGLPHSEVIAYAKKKGVTVVAAAGNDGQNKKYYPGANPYVIAVGAADNSGNVTPFSTYGAHVSVIAPGAGIYSSYGKKDYAYSSGTSQAAPFVSGSIALMKAVANTAGSTLKDHQIKYLIKHTSDKVSTRIKDLRAGFGHINVPDSIRLLQYKLNFSS